MNVTRIDLTNFRNYTKQSVSFTNHINLIVGRNAQGKTNLLESLFVCAVGKSLRSRDKELIQTGATQARLKMWVERKMGNTLTEMVLSTKENKRISLGGIPLLRTGELLGSVNAIFFAPDDLKLIKDAPESRRRFLDMDLSQVYKSYYFSLTKYNRALLSRNNLLKRYTPSMLGDMLYPYDKQLADEGGRILGKRLEYVTKLSVESAKVHAHLTNGEEKLGLEYSTNLPITGDISAQYLAQLDGAREKDINLKYTTVGIHRDDLKITINGIDVRVYGSQGQQRTAALSLKLAELELFREISGEYPILLLDDVLSELDESRQRRLLEICSSVQTILTATDVQSSLLEGIAYAVYVVENGNVIRRE